jgi:HD-like signal output (HDOD) protein
MGKIIFASVHPDLIEKISRFCKEKNIPSELFEDMTAGLNHSQIGALIAEKWNFPESLVNSIKYHHEPQDAPNAHKDVVNTVYLANAFCNLEEKTVTFDQIDKTILSEFHIQTEDQVNKIIERLSKAFMQEAR